MDFDIQATCLDNGDHSNEKKARTSSHDKLPTY